jgi:hypothetical protein
MACYCDDEFDCVLFPPEVGQVHFSSSCEWTCCGLCWNVDVCPNSVKCPSNRVPNAKASSIQRDHRGLMACNKCGHNLGKVSFSLDKRRTLRSLTLTASGTVVKLAGMRMYARYEQ